MTERIKLLLPELKKIGNQMYAYYGGPVYLIGSSLEKEQAKDIDIRVIVSVEDFERLFGSYDAFISEYQSGDFGLVTWRWAENRLKRCRVLSAQTKQNIDFCCWGENMWNPVYPHLRLDTRGDFDI